MFLQFFSSRTITVAKKDVIKIVRGTIKDRTGCVVIPNKAVVEIVDAKAKKLLSMYPSEFEPWGEDAVQKKVVIKSKASKPKGHSGRDIA